MKTRYVVLVLLSFILFTQFSCDEDDINNEDEPVTFTSTNYIYEGDLRIYYLETKNAQLEAQIAVWQQVPDSDPGYNDAQANIVEANNEITSNEEEANAIMSPANAFFIVNPIPPIPPAPSPCLCLIEYNTFRHIVLQPGTDEMNLTITSIEDQSIVASTNNNTAINTIANTDAIGKYQSFELSQANFTGEVLITVDTETRSYSVLAYLQNLE